MTITDAVVIGGVDTHKDQHHAAVVDGAGRVLGSAAFTATASGYRQLHNWMAGFGTIERVGVEGTGSYGAGLARHLIAHDVTVIEVNRPNRQTRRRRGKSDPTDAEMAARAALNGDAQAVAKTSDGPIEAIRMLRLELRSATKARTQAANQLHAVLDTAPEALRAKFGELSIAQLVARASRFHAVDPTDPTSATKFTLRGLARRYQHLDTEIGELRRHLADLARHANPGLLAVYGVGPDTATALLTAAGDNPHRLHSEAGFAAVCGVSPLDASSGRHQRHRLNRGGNRDANHALWRIVMVRLRWHQPTKDYFARRVAEGRTKKEAIRCLKRYVAREIYRHLVTPATPG